VQCTIVNFLKYKGQIWCSYLHCLLLYFQVIAEVGVDVTQFLQVKELR